MISEEEEEEEEGEELQRGETGDLFINFEYFPSLSQLPNRKLEEERNDFEKWVFSLYFNSPQNQSGVERKSQAQIKTMERFLFRLLFFHLF